jgi:hypothetical protein
MQPLKDFYLLKRNRNSQRNQIMGCRMSISFYQLHVKTKQTNNVKLFLTHWLEDFSGGKPSIYENQGSAFEFFNSETPTIFALCMLHENWVTILHDSYEQLPDLANRLSLEFNATVLNVMAQSTVDTYYLSVHQNGKLVRKIYSGEDVIGIDQEGEPFTFEELPIGTNIGTEIDPFYCFDYHDMHEFCLHFHVDLMKDPSNKDGQWAVIKRNNASASTTKKNSLFRSIVGSFFK